MKFYTLLLLSVLLVASVVAGPIPNEAMINAKTLEELRQAQTSYAHAMSGDKDYKLRNHLRSRMLEEDEVLGPKLAGEYNGTAGFYHGVASGDPLPEAVVIWTRFTPETVDAIVEIEVRMAKVDEAMVMDELLDPSKNSAIKRALATTTADDDFVVKLDITGLEAATSYVYGFIGPDGEASRVGLTKTAPATDAEVDQVRYAVFSCAHFGNGYFHAYDIASTLSDLDFWIHMGDYIYEYGTYSTYASNSAERRASIDPVWEVVDLEDYRRRYAVYHTDEGLQNLRARAPQISVWDDHETANDSHGDGNATTSGAENHQEVCPVNRTSPDEEKEAAGCDEDEGDWIFRTNNACKAYMEWMPLRSGPFGSMGFVGDCDLTQVIEWGDLATFVLLDTRLSERSATPTGGTTFNEFGLAYLYPNVSTYTEEPLVSQFAAIHDAVMEEINNPEYTMIGSKTDFLEEKFADSKAAGKPWQVFGSSTMMGPFIPPNLNTIGQFAKSPEAQIMVQSIADYILGSDLGAFYRLTVAQALTGTPWNLDDYNGFGNERRIILDILRDSANNGVVLGGDLHDSWAWQMYESGEFEGTPVAINVGCPGVASPGWYPMLAPLFDSIAEAIGGEEGIVDLLNDSIEANNPGLVYGDVGLKGFFVVTADKSASNIEYYGMTPTEILMDYETGRETNGGSITAAYTCGSHLVSVAGEPGSLTEADECVVPFDSERPVEWSIPLVVSEDTPVVSLSGCGALGCEVEATSLEPTEDDDSAAAHFRVVSACAAALAFLLVTAIV